MSRMCQLKVQSLHAVPCHARASTPDSREHCGVWRHAQASLNAWFQVFISAGVTVMLSAHQQLVAVHDGVDAVRDDEQRALPVLALPRARPATAHPACNGAIEFMKK